MAFKVVPFLKALLLTMFAHGAGIILYYDDQTRISRSYIKKDPILGLPKRELIDLMAAYALLLYTVPGYWRLYNPLFFRRHQTMLRLLYVLSTVLNVVYCAGVCFDTTGGIGHWHWTGLNIGSMMFQVLVYSSIELIVTGTSTDADEENVEDKQQL